MFNNIGITGSRLAWSTEAEFQDALFPFYHMTSKPHFFIGGAIGVDNDALIYVAENWPDAAITVVVPWTLDRQPPEARKTIGRYVGFSRIELIEMKQRLPVGSADGYHERNRYIVDHTQVMIGFPIKRHPERSRGTMMTLEYASQCGKPYFVYPLSERQSHA